MDAIYSAGNKLINEFSNIRYDIVFEGHPCVRTEEMTEDLVLEIYDEFDFIFQNEFKRPSVEDDNYILLEFGQDPGYYQYLNKLRLEFYDEINSILNYESSSFLIYNTLLNYKNRFTELRSNYYDATITYERGDDGFQRPATFPKAH